MRNTKVVKVQKNRQAFTIVELLIAVAIIAILAGLGISSNIKGSLQRARDSKRKQDLNKLVRHFEDYYSDRLIYPPANPGEGTLSGVNWGDPFPQYNFSLPKDPVKDTSYYYESESGTQSYFAVYARLENTDDDDIETVGCKDGCGPSHYYNYVVHSSNVAIVAGLPSLQGQGGGGGGGGGGGPTATPAVTGIRPTPTGPTPTMNLNPPTDCATVCELNQCCRACWCGASNTEEGGQACGNRQLCAFQSYPDKWICAFVSPCPGA